LNRVDVRFIEQHTRIAIENEIQETSEKSGETCLPGKTLEETSIYLPEVKTSFKVLTKGGQGNR
jgi:hypothetical protein